MRIFTALIALFLFQTLHAQNAGTDLNVYVKNLPEGKARMVGVWGDRNFIIDSANVDAQGHFALRRSEPLPEGYYYFLLPGQKNFALLLDKDQHFTLRCDAADPTGTMQVENGGLDTRLLYENFRFQSTLDPQFKKISETLQQYPPGHPLHEQAKAEQDKVLAARKKQLEDDFAKYPESFYTKFKQAGQNPELPDYRKPNGDMDTVRRVVEYRNQFWNGVDFRDERLLRTPVIGNKLRRYITELTPQQPDSIIKVADPLIKSVMPYPEYFKFFTNWIGLNYENGKTSVMDGEAVYVHVIQNFIKPELASWNTKEEIEALQKKAWEMQASLLGRKGPDVRAKDINGQFKSIYEKTAPIVVVMLYSPDCEHCQKDAPEIQKIYTKWKDKGVDFYSIAVSTNDAEWKAFVRKYGLTFTNVYDPTNREIYAKYYVDITPELYVLNKDRIIVAKNLKAFQLEEVFEREFQKMGR